MKKKINSRLMEEGFRPFSEMSYEEYLPYQEKTECSDLTYVMLFSYDETYPYLVKKIKNCLVIVGVDTKFEAFCVLIPLVEEELAEVYEEVTALFKKLKISMRLGTMSEKYAKMLESHPLTEKIGFQEERSDYVYEIAEYLNLEGGKNARKRRDLNKIQKEYNNIRVETVRDFQGKKKDIMEVMKKWCDGYDCDKCVYGCEKNIIERLLNSDLINKLYGSVMYIGDRPEMFAIAQVIGNTCYLYFKKSAERIQGSFYYFEYAFLQPVKNVKYVNFEEDMGLPGLREYKRRRHPVKMIDKYDIQIKGMKEEKSHESQGTLTAAAEEDRQFLTALWQEAFGDSRSYIDEFLDFHFSPKEASDSVFLWRENGENRTMLFALPAKIRIGGQEKDARYLYAIATKKEYRGRKILRKMLPEVKRVLGEECVLFLVPEAEVIPYYESLGLVLKEALPEFSVSDDSASDNSASDKSVCEKDVAAPLCAASENISMREITDAALYKRLREKQLEGKNSVLWSENEILWALRDIFMAKGKVYVIKCSYGEHVLAGKWIMDKGERCFQIIETTLPEEAIRDFGAEIMGYLDCTKIKRNQLFYMIEKDKAEENLYLSLALND